MSDVTVLTPALPERLVGWLPGCVLSVRSQTIQPSAHIIGVDYDRIGCAAMLTKMLDSVRTRWIAILADDDEMLPNHLETCLNMAGPETLLVQTAIECPMRRSFERMVNRPADWSTIRDNNTIHGLAFLRTEAVRELGGWATEIEDWDLWIRMAAYYPYPESWYVYVDEVTQRVNVHGGNTSGITKDRKQRSGHR